MLVELTADNHPHFKALCLKFDKGFTAVTGSSGAGKSRLIESLAWVFAQKSVPAKLNITLSLKIQANEQMQKFLADNDLSPAKEITIERAVKSSRSRFWINGTPVLARLIESFAEQFVTFSAQHANHLFKDKRYALEIIDSVGKFSQLKQIEQTFEQIKKLQVQRDSLTQGQNEAAIELLRYQVDEFNSIDIAEGEVEELITEYKNLCDFHENRERHASAFQKLETVILPALAEVQSEIKLANPAQMVSDAYILLQETINELGGAGEVEFDQERFNEVEKRVNDFYQLARKHRVKVEQLYEVQQQLRERLAAIEGGSQTLAKLDAMLASANNEYAKLANELSTVRKELSATLSAKIIQNMAKLGLKDQRLEFTFEKTAGDSTGTDAVSLKISDNNGTRAVNKGASGGEQSRLMLAIAQVLGNSKNGIMIFDEIDTGLSGALTTRVGEMLKASAKNQQVIAITHHAQVAALATNQIYVEKTKQGPTAKSLSPAERIDALAALISDGENIKTAKQHAKALLGSGA